jgi:hypothetical protein
LDELRRKRGSHPASGFQGLTILRPYGSSNVRYSKL